MISYLLGLIVAAGVVLDFTPMRKAYIVLTLFIILLIAIDKNLRQSSKTLDLLATIFQPVNLGTGMRKVVYYSKFSHNLFLIVLNLIELLKILSGIYCIITLSVENIPNVWVIYWLLGALLLESTLGLLIYSVVFICVLSYDDFYFNLLHNMSVWYLKDSIIPTVYKDRGRILLEFSDLPSNPTV